MSELISNETVAMLQVGHRRKFLRRMFRRRSRVVAVVFLALLVIAVTFGATLSPYGFAEQNLLLGAVPPSADHWLGTDSTGRDVLTRVLYAGRISLLVGFCAALLDVTIGLLVGTV